MIRWVITNDLTPLDRAVEETPLFLSPTDAYAQRRYYDQSLNPTVREVLVTWIEVKS